MELPEIPFNKELTYVGITTYRDKNQLFGIKRKDRRQHVYLLGKSGTGKSVLMFNMIIQNIQNGDGVCLVDPHGENVEAVLSAIPPHRVKDVIYFNPADADYHIGFNVLELVDPQYKHLVASGLMGIFTKIWANAWSARMEYILNNTILALLDTPGSTMLGIPRMLVDKDYRQKIISNLKDPVIKAFWVHEYEAWQDKFRNEAIAPIQNKVGQFLSTSIIRNVVGQQKSTINIFDMMNEGKIFLVNVSKGRIGEDNSALLGGMIITKIQLAAMERVRIPEEERKDFYLYVDEFQNFVTDAFAGILSEARKYRLNLTVAHQYTAQLVSDKSTAVRDAVFGNVGTMIIFRVGADDAEFLEKEFDPEFTPQDIVNLPNYKIYLKLMIDGITSRPFSAKTLPPMVKGGNKEIEDEVIRSSRELYCRSKEDVEAEINNWSGMSLGSGTDGLGASTAVAGKFPAICSSCHKETTVPFKPEPGRPVYCKECVAKIKSGELKPIKASPNQIKQDETKFFKPLADLGIEFKQKDGVTEEVEEYAERPASHTNTPQAAFGQPNMPASKPISQASKQGMPEGIKRPVRPDGHSGGAFNNRLKSVRPPLGENLALKEVLSRVATANSPSPSPDIPAKVEAPAPEPVSLDVLKNKMKEMTPKKDKSASEEEKDKLKNLITAVGGTPQEAVVAGTSSADKAGTEPPLTQDNIKEVPEDVLRKILE
ncbi:MAG TPA: CxxC-x17-CxxC domain-containing protein [Candidatus Paceibacterota bacterium]|jgi:CxxC-x17-CxxC domain-containing protein|nr:CxxC-x17-CxxC domain-containing protein [Candidatus Paceibacterota bacterium]